MFVVAGESLIDLVAGADETYVPVPGGAPYNFARALALQGIATTYLNPFSTDHFGALLRRTLAESGARHSGRSTDKPTSLALVTTTADGQPEYSFYRDRVADRDIDSPAVRAATQGEITGFHTGALALVPPDDQTMLAAMRDLRARGSLCTVDINMRPQVAQSMGVAANRYAEAALAAASLAHVAKVSDEDLRHLGFSGSPQVAARALLHRGCRLVVLTLGAEGAWAISAEDQVYQAAETVVLVDTVGAGDCFFAGFVAALYHRGALLDLQHRVPSREALGIAMHHATASAAINLSRRGCQPPTWDEVVARRGA
jgi:fructokinase